MRHGFLLIDKPQGITSHDVVSKLRRMLGESKVGHLGTLDPAATGLMVLAVGGKALKVVELFAGLPKEYQAEVRLGATSTTYDGEGMITESPTRAGWEPPADASRIQTIIAERFMGSIRQVPPQHSAVHVGGVRAYEQARRGVEVEIPARTVTIESCELLSYEYPLLKLKVACGAGTYVRSLAHDLGEALRCGGYVKSLKRTRMGEWSLTDARSIAEASWTDVMPLKAVMTNFAQIEVTSAQWRDIQFGKSIPGTMTGDPMIAWFEGLPTAIMEADPKKVRMVKPRKVL